MNCKDRQIEYAQANWTQSARDYMASKGWVASSSRRSEATYFRVPGAGAARRKIRVACHDLSRSGITVGPWISLSGRWRHDGDLANGKWTQEARDAFAVCWSAYPAKNTEKIKVERFSSLTTALDRAEALSAAPITIPAAFREQEGRTMDCKDRLDPRGLKGEKRATSDGEPPEIHTSVGALGLAGLLDHCPDWAATRADWPAKVSCDLWGPEPSVWIEAPVSQKPEPDGGGVLWEVMEVWDADFLGQDPYDWYNDLVDAVEEPHEE